MRRPVVKRISSPAIQFKGNGWYITDYAKKSSSPAGHRDETKSPAKTEAKSGSDSEARAEAKAAPARATAQVRQIIFLTVRAEVFATGERLS